MCVCVGIYFCDFQGLPSGRSRSISLISSSSSAVFRRPSTHKNMCINLFLSPISLKEIYYYYIFFSHSLLLIFFCYLCHVIYLSYHANIYYFLPSLSLTSPYRTLFFHSFSAALSHFLKNNK